MNNQNGDKFNLKSIYYFKLMIKKHYFNGNIHAYSLQEQSIIKDVRYK